MGFELGFLNIYKNKDYAKSILQKIIKNKGPQFNHKRSSKFTCYFSFNLTGTTYTFIFGFNTRIFKQPL